jgi:hypothetical protein
VSNHFPIPVPPPELVKQWSDIKPMEDAVVQNWVKIATQAAQWGADQQLEATDTWIRTEMKDRQRPVNRIADDHRADMRPKPPRLKEQALAVLDDCANCLDGAHENTIRRALEALND